MAGLRDWDWSRNKNGKETYTWKRARRALQGHVVSYVELRAGSSLLF
jgi:hypothetical protein